MQSWWLVVLLLDYPNPFPPRLREVIQESPLGDARVARERTLRLAANWRVLSTVISLPAALRKAFVHFSLRGLRFILNYRGSSVSGEI